MKLDSFLPAPLRPNGALLFLLILPATAVAQNSVPVVSNVVATQIAGTGQVRVTYDVSDADGDPVTARVIFSLDNGVNFNILPVSVSGHVNITMPAGPGKEIVWNAAADFPGVHWTQVVAKVYASDGPAFSGEMVFVPAGNFIMGSSSGTSAEQPQHTVYLDAFQIDKYEITNAEFKQFIDAGGYSTQAYWSPDGWSIKNSRGWSQPSSYSPYQPGYPVLGVSWYEAEAYANFVGKRLPTEAEWEKAARGTDGRTFPWGEGSASDRTNTSSDYDPFNGGPSPVGFYDGRLHPNPLYQTIDSPSPYGAYDVLGNAQEWVRDIYSSDYYASSPSANPTGPLTGGARGLRGGAFSFSTGPVYRRSNNGPDSQNYYNGFRCAKPGP